MEKGDEQNSDEITQWMTRTGRKTLDLAGAKQLAAESPDHWYVALQGTKGYIVGKMTMQTYSARHILVDEKGQPMYFPTADAAARFLRKELNIQKPHMFGI